MINTKLKEIIQRVLDCTLWNHLPYESADIIRNENLKEKTEICNELLRQKLKLIKQLNKVDCAYTISLEEILKDRNSATDQKGKPFRSKDICVVARYTVTENFVYCILVGIKKCEIDPDTIPNIILDIPYTIDYHSSYGIMDNMRIYEIRDALLDLWFVSSTQFMYNDEEQISQIICKCILPMNNSEEPEEDEKCDQKIDINVEPEKEEHQETKEYPNNVEYLRNAIMDGVVPNWVASHIEYINGFANKDVVACAKEIFNDFCTSCVLEKQCFDAIKKLFSHKHYVSDITASSDTNINSRVEEVSNAFLDQVINAINVGSINKTTETFCTVIEHELSYDLGETRGSKYAEIYTALKNLWFVKSIYHNYDMDCIRSLMIVCEVQIHNKDNDKCLSDSSFCKKELSDKIINQFNDFCTSIMPMAEQFNLEKAVYDIIQLAAIKLAHNTDVSYTSDASMTKVIINNLLFLNNSDIPCVDILRYIEHNKDLIKDPISFITLEFLEAGNKDIANEYSLATFCLVIFCNA